MTKLYNCIFPEQAHEATKDGIYVVLNSNATVPTFSLN